MVSRKWAFRGLSCVSLDSVQQELKAAAGAENGWGRGAMVLSVTDHRAMMKGFEQAGFNCTEVPGAQTNPVRIEWHVDGQTVRHFRLWAFDVTHGGGGAEVRAADEF